MSSSTLRYVKSGAELLAVACFALLFGPWFVFWSAGTREPALLALYWRLAAILLAGASGAMALRPWLSRQTPDKRQRVAIAFAVVTTPVAADLALAPMLASRDLEQYWVFAGFVGLVAWLRGLGYGSSSPSSADLHRHLLIGSISLAVCLFAAERTGIWGAVLPQAVPLVVAWCSGAVVTTSLMRFLEITRKTSAQELRSRFWPSLLSSVVLGSLVSAALLTILAPAVWAGVRSLFPLLRSILSIIGAPIAFVLRILSEAIAWLVMLLSKIQPKFKFKLPEGAGGEDFLPKQLQPDLPPEYLDSLRWVFLVLAAVAVVVLAVRYLLARLYDSVELAPDETRESFASPGALRQWTRRLRRLLARLLQRLGERVRGWASEPSSATGFYHVVLSYAARAGRPKPESVTPLTFQPTVHEVFEGSEEPAGRILHGFMDEYYGDVKLPAEQIEKLRLDWRRLKEQVSESRSR